MSKVALKGGDSGTGKVLLLAPNTNTDRRITLPDKDGELDFPVITKEYESTPQTVTSAGLLTLSHGLGVAPKFVEFHLVFVGAEDGFSIGDVIQASLITTASSSLRWNTSYFDSTNVYFKYSNEGSCFSSGIKSTGGAAAITNSNINLIVKAYA